MVIWSIAVKNFKELSKNYLLLALLVLMPLMQIYMIDVMTQNAVADGAMEAKEGLVELLVLSNTPDNLLQVFSAAILVQFLLMTSMIAGATIVGEREQNTMMRMYAAPVSKIKMLTGVLLGHSTTVLMVATIIISASYGFFNVYWGESWISVSIVTMMAVYVATAVAFTISGIFKSAKIAGGVMSLVVIGMTFMSGGLIQSEKLEVVSNFTINKWIAESYITLAQGGILKDIAIELFTLAIIGTILMVVASFLYRRENIYE